MILAPTSAAPMPMTHRSRDTTPSMLMPAGVEAVHARRASRWSNMTRSWGLGAGAGWTVGPGPAGSAPATGASGRLRDRGGREDRSGEGLASGAGVQRDGGPVRHRPEDPVARDLHGT